MSRPKTSQVERLPIVSVIGSGVSTPDPPWAERAQRLGEWLAHRGVHLLTGAGAGVMTAVSKAFATAEVNGGRRGRVLGVVPCVDGKPKEAKNRYPNEWVEIPLYTHLPLSGKRGHEEMSRNHVIALTGDVVVALPGTEGTLSEVRLAWSYGKPLFLFLEKHDEIHGLERTFSIENDFGRLAAAIDTALSKIWPGVRGHIDG